MHEVSLGEWKMMPSFLTVWIMPDKSCLRRVRLQGACACVAMVMVWGSIFIPTPRATAHAAATGIGTIGGASEANTPVHQGGAALEEQLQTHLNVIQWHDQYDAVLLSAIEFIGNVGDKRAINPLIEAWGKRTERQIEAIQRGVEKLQIKDRSDLNEALLVKQVVDQIIDEINTALESLGIERESIIHINREALKKGSAKAIAILVKYKDEDSIPLLLDLLKKGDDKVRNYNEALE